MPRGHFLFRSAGKGSKRGRSDRRDGRLCTALQQRQDWATNEPVRRSSPNSTPHGVSNIWEASFLPSLHAKRRMSSGQKSPHEPRRRRSALLPWPSVSVSVDEGLAWELFWDFNHWLRNNILCAKIGFTKQICVENRLRLKSLSLGQGSARIICLRGTWGDFLLLRIAVACAATKNEPFHVFETAWAGEFGKARRTGSNVAYK